MRFSLVVLIALTASLAPSIAEAQGERKPPEITTVQIGFQAFHRKEQTTFKVGMWTPVYIEIFGGSDGLEAAKRSYIEIQTSDSEDVGTRVTIPITIQPLDTRTVMTYVKTGHMTGGGGEVVVTLHAHNREFKPVTVDVFWTLEPSAHLYLTLGQEMRDVFNAARRIGRQGEGKDKDNEDLRLNQGRQAVFETDVKRLPDAWFGYSGVDLIILSTENKEFLKALNNSPEKLKALAQWVRRGGRLVIPIAHPSQPLVSKLLKNPIAWQPPIPVVPPSSPGKVQDLAVRNLTKVASWGRVLDKEFKHPDPNNPQKFLPIEVALLDDGKALPGDWDVKADTEDGRALIARVRYGLGQITYFAFSFDDRPFQEWAGRDQFLQNMLKELGPRAPDAVEGQDQRFGRGEIASDLTTKLIAHLDTFDVTIIPFGYVALFIVLYILVVGPIDFFLLKYVFKRLEWTWITFPTVVLGVSVIAYFAAYALKGRDLKINKVDVVDFDLRTSRDPKTAHAYGRSFVTILSPRIQNYTIGLEPNPAFWGAEARQVKLPNGQERDEVFSADLMSWLGRPSGGPHEMRRSGGSGFFRKPYDYADDFSALKGVPIPVWTTKAFCAAWEQPLKSSPFTVDLAYHTKEFRGKNIKISGKLASHLGVDLHDVWIIYQTRCYPIPGGLKSIKHGEAGMEITLPAQAGQLSPTVQEWLRQVADDDARFETTAWNADLPFTMKMLLFHERADLGNNERNHSLRMLDQGWRISEEALGQQQHRGVREAILFARVRPTSGSAETLARDATHPLPTKLWLGEFPETGRNRPDLIGHMNQETFVRVILPVRPANE